MLRRLGIESRLDLAIFVSLALLVAVSPLGNEATHPIVLGTYRSLLLLIIVAATIRTRGYRMPPIHPLLMAAAAVVLLAMFLSAVLRPGSNFDGFYYFYQNALFLAAFISLASFNRSRSPAWKSTIAGVVVLVDIVYLITAWLPGTRPLLGPFVNANYFASFLSVGFACCVAAALLSHSMPTRLAAVGAGLFLLYGIGQTASRGAFLAVLAILSAGLFRLARRHRIALWRVAVIGILIVVIGAAANPALMAKFSDRGQRDPYNYQRTQIWLKAMEMIASYPVLGVGPGRFYYVSKLFTPAMEGTIGRYGRWANIAHSEYLQYTAELGIPIAVLMFAIGAGLFRLAWRRSGTVAPESRIFQEAAILTAAGLGVHALVDNNWTVPVVAAALAIVSLADLLPYGSTTLHLEWTPVRKTALGMGIAFVFIQGIGVPAVGLFFNEAGHQAYVTGNFERAEQMHRLALGIIPNHPLLMDNLGMVYFDEYERTRKIEYLDHSELLFRDSIAANPASDLPAGHLENVLFQRLTGDVSKDQPIHAQLVATDLFRLQFTPYNPFVRKNLAEALYNMGKKLDAVRQLQEAIAQEPNYLQAYTRLAEWQDESGQHREAAQNREKANEIATRYKDQVTTDNFESMLLGRPVAIAGKP